MRGRERNAEFVERIPLRRVAGGLRIASEGSRLGGRERRAAEIGSNSSIEVARSGPGWWAQTDETDETDERRSQSSPELTAMGRSMTRAGGVEHPSVSSADLLGGPLGHSLAYQWAKADAAMSPESFGRPSASIWQCMRCHGRRERHPARRSWSCHLRAQASRTNGPLPDPPEAP